MALTQVSTGGIKDGQVHTADLADGQITVGKLHADALDRTYTLGASGNNHYTFTGEGLTGAVNDPTLYLTRGKTYRFVNGNSAGAHPFRIQTTVNGSAGTEYNTGVTNNGGAGGSTIVFEVPHAAPDVLYYQCTSHGSMGGILYVTGALADGTVTTAKLAADAVDGTKIADDAIDSEHIAADSIDSEHYAAGSVDTTAISDNAVTLAKLENGTSSNDGKFLRANNGADPTFETVSGTTINNNADNRVITGSDTANTLNGESSVIIDSSGRLGIGKSNPAFLLEVSGATPSSFRLNHSGETGSGSHDVQIVAGGAHYQNMHFEGSSIFYRTWDGSSVGERFRIRSTGGVTFNGDTADANALDDYEEGSFTPVYFMSGGGQNVTYHDQQGQYVKIGKFVHCSIHLRINTVHANGSGVAGIGGLPFQGASNTGQGPGYGTGAVGYINGQGGGDWWHGYVEQGQTACYIYYGASSGTSQNVTIANHLYNAGSLRISISYQIT